MAIEFIVEDWTGKPNSTSYGTVAEYKQWLENRGEVTTMTDDEIKAKLNVATEFIDSLSFVGAKTSLNNSLEWPRCGILNITAVKQQNDIKKAMFYAALNQDDLFQVNDGLVSYSYGPVSKTYNQSQLNNSRFLYINKMLGNYLVHDSGLMRVN